MKNLITKTYTDQNTFELECINLFKNFKYARFEHCGKYYKLEEKKDWHGKIYFVLLVTTNKSYIGGYVVGCNKDLSTLISKYIVGKNIPLKIIKTTKIMKQGLFTDVNAVIKEEIAGLKNIKIHFQMNGDFDKIQKVSLAIRQLEILIGA